ncbi:MAG TPA: lactate racemase domain-containing protein [Thermoleophilaceae bacterium]|jgi:hypothetical protein
MTINATPPPVVERGWRSAAPARARRAGTILEIHEKSPPTLFFDGPSMRLERLPVGTRVIYPQPSLRGLADVDAAISAALGNPSDMEPLEALLKPGMRLTISFDDVSLPLPQMRPPDIRGRIIEEIVARAYRAGVDDIHLIGATAFHRRMTEAELKHLLGPNVFAEFYPDRLYSHDAEDPDNIAFLGETEKGEKVELNRRAAESDLLIHVSVKLTPMQGGRKSVPVGLGTYQSLRAHHTAHALKQSRSFLDPENSELHHSSGRQGDVVASAVRLMQIEVTLNNDSYPRSLSFLGKPEPMWTRREQLTFASMARAMRRLPANRRSAAIQGMRAPYQVTGIFAGEVNAVNAAGAESCAAQLEVPVEGQTDILTTGVHDIGPYNVNSTMNPILVMCMALGYYFNLYHGKPLVREGGVLIFTHPVRREFHPVHHPSYIDFYEEVLPQAKDPAEVERFEQSYAEDEWYRHLYRTSYSFHGAHPFYMWYWGAHALDHVGAVIFVGGDPEVCRHMGFRSASTMQDAIEMAKDVVGTSSPSMTQLHFPPAMYCKVT